MVPLIFGADGVCTRGSAGRPDRFLDINLSAPVGADAPRVLNRAGDVRQIQAALNRFPSANGGPDQPLVVDGICGSLTKAAILQFQVAFDIAPAGSTISDGIVDLKGDTVERLQAGPSIVDGPTEFFERIPDVMRTVTAAGGLLDAAIFQLQFGDRPGQLPSLNQLGQAAVDRVDRHFKINQTTDPIARMRQVKSIFLAMQTAIGHVPQGLFLAVNTPPGVHPPAFAFTGAGGFSIQDPKVTFDGSGLPVNSIYIMPSGRALGKDQFIYLMIHELAHFVGPQTPDRPGDRELFIGDLAPFIHGRIGRLTPDQTLRNADSYAQFAFDAIGKNNFNIKTGGPTPALAA